MTKEEKQLLIKDICQRLLYGVKFACNKNIYTAKGLGLIVTDEGDWEYAVTAKGIEPIEIEYIKPYLRSMSSMTKEEIEECSQLQEDTFHVRFYKYDEGYEKTIDLPYFEILVDFFNSHHLDFRGLIPMGLALEAPEDMYK